MRHCLCLLFCMVIKQLYEEERERYRIRTIWIDNLRVVLGIKRMDKVPNTGIRELCGLTKFGGGGG